VLAQRTETARQALLERLRAKWRSPLELEDVWGDARGKHREIVSRVVWLKGDRELLTISAGRAIQRWSVATGQLLGSLSLKASPGREYRGIAQLHGDWVVYRTELGVEAVSSLDGEIAWQQDCDPPSLQGFHLHPSRERFVTCDEEKIVCHKRGSGEVLWKLERQVQPTTKGDCRVFASVAGTRELLVADKSGVYLVDWTHGKLIAQIGGFAVKSSVGLVLALSPDGRFAATASTEGRVQLWDLRGRRSIGDVQVVDVQPKRGVHGTRALAFARDSERLYVGSDDGSLAVVKVSSLRVRWRAQGHNNWVTCIAPGPGNRVAQGGYSRSVQLWAKGIALWPVPTNGDFGFLAATPSRVLSVGDEIVRWDKARAFRPSSIAPLPHVKRAVISPSGKSALVYRRGYALWLNLDTGTVLRRVKMEPQQPAAFLDEERLVIGVPKQGQSRPRLDLVTPAKRIQLPAAGGEHMARGLQALGPDTLAVVSEGNVGRLKVVGSKATWKASWEVRRTFRRDAKNYKLAWTHFDSRAKRVLLVYNAAKAKRAILAEHVIEGEVRSLVTLKRRVKPLSLAFCPWGAAWVQGGELWVWVRGRAPALHPLPPSAGTAQCVTEGPEGKDLLVGTARGVILRLRAPE
jgi:hypothetical protein